MLQRRSSFGIATSIAALVIAFGVRATAACAQETITIDAHAQTTPFPHFWEQMFGSGHAILSLRAGYRDDLRAVKSVTEFRYVRFHGILNHEVGVYDVGDDGKPIYNFSYVDQIYDGLLKNGVRPFVEISFMPRKLAFNPDDLHAFWYKPNVSPPKSWEQWDDLMKHFAQHLVDRYGIDEVSQWYFEVWNEPNIDFWGGIPRQASYFDLYDHTARDLKSVSPRLRVGGPATAAASWVVPFLQHVAENHVPIDFVSTHAYADDTVENLFHNDKPVPMDDRVCGAVKKVQGQMEASPLPKLPLFWTEWNVQGMDASRDTPFVGPGVANTIRECDGHVNLMSFWTFDDVFEEGGVARTPFEGGFGLIALGGIKKPSYYDFSLLHQLGDARIANTSQNVLVTRNKDGGLAIAVWNLVDPGEKGTAKTVHLAFEGLASHAPVTISRVDESHGDPMAAYRAMGSPQYPTMAQVEKLNAASAPPPPTQEHLDGSRLTLQLGPNALVMVKIPAASATADTK
jgi:xylan 1,4-beta-xylosidase